MIRCSFEEFQNLSVEIFDYPVRNKKNHRNFEIFLPKFHFILPNFYFPVPWRNFVFSLAVSDFLVRDCISGWNVRSETWMNSLYSIAVRLLDFDQSTVFFVGNSSFMPRKL